MKNVKKNGASFSAAEKLSVWRKGKVVAGYDPAVLRKDSCGAWIRWSAYGSTTEQGWEIDHVRPIAEGGVDELWNLQPLQWQNNRHKSDNWPSWSCAVSAA